MDELSIFSRTEKLIGPEKLLKLKNSHVIVFGIGGVGSFVAEALARAGIGTLTLVDNDVVSVTNINRQLIALNSTIGQGKTAVMKSRILDIDPDAVVNQMPLFFSEDTAGEFDFSAYTYVADCIDSIPSKVLLIKKAKESNTPIISAMGTGNKLHPELLTLADIKDTSYCSLARQVRTRLKKEGISDLNVVYSKEQRSKMPGVPASISFVPSVAGLLMASKIVNDIIGS